MGDADRIPFRRTLIQTGTEPYRSRPPIDPASHPGPTPPRTNTKGWTHKSSPSCFQRKALAATCQGGDPNPAPETYRPPRTAPLGHSVPPRQVT